VTWSDFGWCCYGLGFGWGLAFFWMDWKAYREAVRRSRARGGRTT
jgi:hypothetical protein